jgi:Helix-turn-helix domain, rpiR family.
VLYSSITELAEKINVGETTIIRFCRHIGLTGFQDFKLNIAKETTSPETSIHENITFSDSVDVLLQK